MKSNFKVAIIPDIEERLKYVPDQSVDTMFSIIPNPIAVNVQLYKLLQESLRVLNPYGTVLLFFFTPLKEYYLYTDPHAVTGLCRGIYPFTHIYTFSYGNYQCYIMRGSFIQKGSMQFNMKPSYYDISFVLAEALEQVSVGGSFVVDPFASFTAARVVVDRDMFYYGISETSQVGDMLEVLYSG